LDLSKPQNVLAQNIREIWTREETYKDIEQNLSQYSLNNELINKLMKKDNLILEKQLK